jgi:hypothetical protein
LEIPVIVEGGMKIIGILMLKLHLFVVISTRLKSQGNFSTLLEDENLKTQPQVDMPH